ncbi:MAG: hypothetical protein IJI34_04650 [Clostridia bacterium]|nr:hypothetical protein [Clostridia bacterium]
MKKAFQKIPKPLRAVLFCFLQWTWGLPQNLVGLLLLPFLRGERYRYHGALVTVYRKLRFTKNRSGFSLGTFIFIPETWTEYDKKHVVVHEYGHTVQSMILGPFYLLFVGLPSVIWSHRYCRRTPIYRSRGVAYTDRYPEHGADRLGEYATGEKPH